MGSVSKAFDLLDAVIASQDRGVSFSDIVSATGLPKSSAHRLLAELRDLGALEYDPDTGRFRGGLRLARLGAGVVSRFDLRAHVHPHLEALHREMGTVSTLGIRNGTVGVYLDKCETADFGIKLHSEVGKEFPLHCTAMGKVLLAHAPRDARDAVLDGDLPAFTPDTLTERPALERQLKAILKDGHAVDRQEITRGLICVAAPVRGPDGSVIGAMSCTFPSYLEQERGLDAAIAAVRRHAAAASGQGQGQVHS
ncbi:MAG: IclR family transcriptional regulator [Rhodobacterales bacterium]|nr:IclR family transcriptional regulator [Rhodobacterales bacterium]